MSKRELPQRGTRGKRMRSVMEEEAGADEEFWNQDFFADERADDDYKTESETDDVPDTDFEESESDEGDSEVEVAKEKPARKALKAPGAPPAAKAKPKPKPKPKPTSPSEPASPGDQQLQAELAYAAPSLRRSTHAKVQAAEERRAHEEATKPKRRVATRDETWRPMTQEALLAEAARTEVENLASLKLLVAQEEETKRRAAVVKKRYMGPTVRWRSFGAMTSSGLAAAGASSQGEQQQQQPQQGQERKGLITLQWLNMKAPPRWLRPLHAPPPPPRPLCAVTGAPARYRDPSTGQPYASAQALQQLRQRSGLQAPAQAAQLPQAGLYSRAAATAATAKAAAGQLPDDVVSLLVDFCQVFTAPAGAGVQAAA